MLNQTPHDQATLEFTRQVVAVDPGIEGITAADFDGDGRPDLAAGNFMTSGAGGLVIYTNKTAPAVTT